MTPMGVVCCDLLKNSEILALGVIRGSYFPGKGSRPRTSWEIASLNNQTTIPLRIFEKCIDHRFHRSPALPWRRARSFRRLFRCRYFCVEETVAFPGPRNVFGGGGWIAENLDQGLSHRCHFLFWSVRIVIRRLILAAIVVTFSAAE